jgi:hypothetical protein
MIDKHGISFHRAECAALAAGHGIDIAIAADTGKHDVGSVRRCGRRRCSVPAKFPDPPFGPGRRTVENGDLITCTGKMPGHGVPHDTQAYESDTQRHACNSSVEVVVRAIPRLRNLSDPRSESGAASEISHATPEARRRT